MYLVKSAFCDWLRNADLPKYRQGQQGPAVLCVLMLLYIVKCLGVLFWVGDGVNPLDGPLFEFGQVSSTSFDFADAAGRHA